MPRKSRSARRGGGRSTRRRPCSKSDKGWKVEGVDGYFDDDGRPIQGPVATERIIEAGDDEEEIGLIPGLDPRVQYGKMKEAVGLGPDEQVARDAYTEGERLFREKKYKDAAEKFSEAVSRGPHSQIEQDAMFMLAESYYFGDRYIKARDAYDALVKEYPNTRYMDSLIDREWKIAQYWENYEEYSPDWAMTPNAYDKTRPWFDTMGHAIKTYDNIRLNDPTGPRADDAIMATANIYFRNGRYDDADYHYTLLRTQYPKSEMQFEAHLLGLQAKLRKYQGRLRWHAARGGQDAGEAAADAVRRPAEPRRKGTAATRRRPAQSGNRHARLSHGRVLRRHEALRRLRIYYAQVIQKYPDTELATQARERHGPDRR